MSICVCIMHISPFPTGPAEFDQMRHKYNKVVDAYGSLGILRINAGMTDKLYHNDRERGLFFYFSGY